MKKIICIIFFFLLFSIIPGKVNATDLTKNFPRKFGIKDNMDTLPIEPKDFTGTSWAQSFIDSIESTISTTTQTEVELSVNNMLVQTSNIYNESYLKSPAEEGDHRIATSYLTSWRGPVLEKDDPSFQKGETLKTPLVTGTQSAYHVQEVLFLPERNTNLDIKLIKEYITNFGSVSATMFFENYKKNYNPKTLSWYCADNDITTPEKTEIVTLFGWNDDYSKNNFTIAPPNDGAFLAKAYGKFFYISYYDMLLGLSGNDDIGLSVITRVEETNNYDNIYQHDPLGYTSKYSKENPDKTAFFANVFTVQDDDRYNEEISAVSFYTLEPDLEYEIYINKDFDDIYSFNKLKLIQKGSISLPGYHTIDLSEKIELYFDKKVAVAVKLISKNTTPSVALESPDSTNKNTADASKNQSFFKNHNGKWIDSTYYKTDSNVCLKIFTDYYDRIIIDTFSVDYMKEDVEYVIKNLKEKNPDIRSLGLSESQNRIISEVREAIKKPLTPPEFYLQLRRLAAMVKDAHVSINQPNNKKYLDLSFKWIEDGIIIDKDSGNFFKGDKILSIGGKTPDDLCELLYDQIPSENNYWIRNRSKYYLTSEFYLSYFNLLNNDYSVDILIDRHGKNIVFKEFSKKKYRVYKKDSLKDDFTWEIEEDNDLAFFRLDSWIHHDSKEKYEKIKKNIHEFFHEVSEKKINNVALDLRLNTGGSPGLFYEIMKYIPKDIHSPYYGDTSSKASDNLLFRGNFYILTSYQSCSQSVIVTRTLSGNNIATILGEPTGEKPNFNMPDYTLILPNTNWNFRITDYKPEKILGFSNDDITIIPDILINRSRFDIAAGRDIQLLRLRELTRDSKNYKYSKNILDIHFSSNEEKISLPLSESNSSEISIDKELKGLTVPFKISDINSSSILSTTMELLNSCTIKNNAILFPSLEPGTYYLSIKLNNGQNFMTLITLIDDPLTVPMTIYSFSDTPEGPLDVSVQREFDDYTFRTVDCYSYIYLKFHKKISSPPYSCNAILYNNDTKVGFTYWNRSAYSDRRLNLMYPKNLKGNTKYRLFIPKNSIRFADGTVYNKDVDITFVHPKIDLTFIVKQDKENNTLTLRFNKKIKLLSHKSFTIINSNNTEVAIKSFKRDRNEIITYTLKDPLISGEKYTLIINSKAINTLSGDTNEKEFVREFIAE